MPGIEETATAFTKACFAADVHFVIVGGFAVAAWGEPRATRDVDALVDLPDSKVERFVAALQENGLSVAALDLRDALREGGHVTVFDDRTGYHVDVKVARTAHEKEEVEAGVLVDLPSGPLRVVRAEEAVAFKLLFGSPLDWQDARSILIRQGDGLDQARLAALAVKLNVAPALRRLKDEVAQARRKG